MMHDEICATYFCPEFYVFVQMNILLSLIGQRIFSSSILYSASSCINDSIQYTNLFEYAILNDNVRLNKISKPAHKNKYPISKQIRRTKVWKRSILGT